MEKEPDQEIEALGEAVEQRPPEGEEPLQPIEGAEERPLAREAGEERPRRRGGGGGRGRRRACVMCVEHMKSVDYKDFGFLRRFLSDRGRMDSRRKTGTCAKHQRALAQAIKRARHLALLPYTAEHIRTGVGPSR